MGIRQAAARAEEEALGDAAEAIAAAAPATAEPLELQRRTPINVMRTVLKEAGISPEELSYIRNCPGFQLELPEGPVTVHYPMGIHCKPLAWTPPNESGAVFARSTAPLFSHFLVQGAPIPTHLPLAGPRLTFTVFSFLVGFWSFSLPKMRV
jgi:hypothetical protein